MTYSMFRVLAVGALVLAVSSCANDKKIDYCPGFASILDAAVVTQFRPGTTPDPANEFYHVRINKVKGHCTFDKQGKSADSSVDITFQATRPAAGAAAQYQVSYFVAVTQATRVITRQERSVTVAFDAGATAATAHDEVDSITLVTDTDKKPYDYQVLVGLQLTQAQLDYNRSVGIFGQ